MRRFRIKIRPVSVADIIKLDKTLEYEQEIRQSAQRGARAQLRRWRQLKQQSI